MFYKQATRNIIWDCVLKNYWLAGSEWVWSQNGGGKHVETVRDEFSYWVQRLKFIVQLGRTEDFNVSHSEILLPCIERNKISFRNYEKLTSKSLTFFFFHVISNNTNVQKQQTKR